LADLIAFNNAHCTEELVYYGQEIFEAAQQTSGYPTNPMYVTARTHARRAARAGIDNAIRSLNLDAIVAPHLTNSTRTCRCRLSKLVPSGRNSRRRQRKTGGNADV
jgi:hypothetical protein